MQTPFLQQIFPAGHAAVPSLQCVSNTKQLQQMAPNQETSQYGKKGNGILLLMHPKWHSILRNDLKMSRCYNKDRLKNADWAEGGNYSCSWKGKRAMPLFSSWKRQQKSNHLCCYMATQEALTWHSPTSTTAVLRAGKPARLTCSVPTTSTSSIVSSAGLSSETSSVLISSLLEMKNKPKNS